MSTTFDSAAYQDVWDKLKEYIQNIDDYLTNDAPDAISAGQNSYATKVTPGLSEFIKTCGEKMLAALKWLWEKLMDLIEGIAAPIFMAQRSFEWSDAKGDYSGVAAAINPKQLLALKEWKGDAQEAYEKTVEAQRDAILKMEETAETCRNHLMVAAAAGLLLYAGVAIVVNKFVTALAFIIAAVASGFGAVPGFAGFWTISGVTAAELSAAIAAITLFVTDQAKAWSDIKAATTNNSAFQKGDDGSIRWPDPNTKYFEDASVEGDNESKWRLNPDK
ncbi:hypothetical protein [Nocardia sp. NPDC050710]|uniref:hypothetical protein n=1 Tax=Nocardia sp. NPDC050710 TaxID=3157220 RepID=UPI0033EB8FFC